MESTHVPAARDKAIGFAILLALVTVAGALIMVLNPGSAAAGWGFALAITAATLAVAATQLFV